MDMAERDKFCINQLWQDDIFNSKKTNGELRDYYLTGGVLPWEVH